MRVVAPRTGADEITIAEDQLEFRPFTVAVYEMPGGSRCLLSRWRLTEEERRLLLTGEDLYLLQLTFDQPMQAIRLQVGPAGYMIP